MPILLIAVKENVNMSPKYGRYLAKNEAPQSGICFLVHVIALFFIELFSFFFLSLTENFTNSQLWPLAFGGLWAVVLGGVVYLLPGKLSRIAYGVVYFASLVYAGFQTGYYILFSEMMWLSELRYASEGADYADALLSHPLGWWLGLAALIALGVLLVWKYPMRKKHWAKRVAAVALAAVAGYYAYSLPATFFDQDKDVKFSGSDYGRSQSVQAAYENMFNPHRLYQICGMYQTLCKDIYTHYIFPLTPEHAIAQAKSEAEIDTYFASQPEAGDNDMTGLLKGKNVVLVLMESMDDWMMGIHTPTISRLMEEGIQFTRFYTPAFGGIRTFNTEFCINTGSFLSSQGGYAFDYVTNRYDQSLASQLRQEGYSAKTFHYNTPTFYSRGEFSPAMGYEEYVCYEDYVEETDEKARKNILYDDLLLFEDEELNAEFFREGKPTLNFIITRSAHLSYKYNEVLSYWGLKKYPAYKGLTGNEETDCAYLKAKLVDDFFARLLTELEKKGQLENTVIIGVTDHYTYGYKDMDSLYALSGVEEDILLERVPWFIWSPGLEARTVDKVLNTADVLPTVLNLLDVDSEYDYMGRDAFDEAYEGFVPFSNGGWIYGDIAYDGSTKEYISISGKEQTISAGLQAQMANQVQEFIRINNLILDTDYYR